MADISCLDTLHSWCQKYQIAYHQQADTRFVQFLDLLQHYQKLTNLVGFEHDRDIVEGLFIDSLMLLRLGTISGPMLDVGTGAGFPAIPVKILCPDLEMILVEPRTKRYAFLQLVKRELGLDNLDIRQAKIESLDVPRLGFAVSKAFAPICQWLAIARPWALKGAQIGCFVSLEDWDNAHDFVLSQFDISACLVENSRVYASLKMI